MDAVIRVAVSTIRVSMILCDVFLYGWTTAIKACTAESSASNDTFQFELLVATLGGKVACNGFTNVNMYIYTLNAPNNCCSLCIIA